MFDEFLRIMGLIVFVVIAPVSLLVLWALFLSSPSDQHGTGYWGG